MNSRSKTNNFIALLIAAILFATGFALYFAHQQLESKEQVGQNQAPLINLHVTSLSAGQTPFTDYPARHI